MSDILRQIVEHKRLEISAAKAARPLEQLRRAAEAAPPTRDFAAAVGARPRPGVALIAEIKKASPSAGVIRADFDPLRIARAYEAAGADALSVLTDEHFFQGRLDYLAAVKAVCGLPLLRKDFILEPYQLYESRVAGADAVLLIGEILSPAEVRTLAAEAVGLGLSVLVEVHAVETLMGLVELFTSSFEPSGRMLLGVNNRDLRSFATRVEHTLELAAILARRADTAGVRLVSESGINSRADVVRLEAAGVRAILVGETLMRAADIAAKVAELLGPRAEPPTPREGRV